MNTVLTREIIKAKNIHSCLLKPCNDLKEICEYFGIKEVLDDTDRPEYRPNYHLKTSSIKKYQYHSVHGDIIHAYFLDDIYCKSAFESTLAAISIKKKDKEETNFRFVSNYHYLTIKNALQNMQPSNNETLFTVLAKKRLGPREGIGYIKSGDDFHCANCGTPRHSTENGNLLGVLKTIKYALFNKSEKKCFWCGRVHSESMLIGSDDGPDENYGTGSRIHN